MVRFSFFQTFNLWLHLLSFVVWLGGMIFFLFVFGPAVHGLPARSGAQVLDKGRKLLQNLSWLAIGLLLVTGGLNFSFRVMAVGFELGPAYYSILGMKLFLFLAMLLHQSLQSLKYGARIGALTAAAPSDLDSWPQPLLFHWKKWFLLLKINATLGPIVLLLGLGLSRS